MARSSGHRGVRRLAGGSGLYAPRPRRGVCRPRPAGRSERLDPAHGLAGACFHGGERGACVCSTAATRQA